MKLFIVFSFISLFSGTTSTFAHESEIEPYGYSDAENIYENAAQPTTVTIGPETLEKLDVALKALNVPQEKTPNFSSFPHHGTVNQIQFEKNIPYIDPQGAFTRYLSVANSMLQMFRVFYNPQTPTQFIERQFYFGFQPESIDSEPLISRLSTIADQVQAGNPLPLKGLKILIDPGHMGGKKWDQLTGKFVQPSRVIRNSKNEITRIIPQGPKVSEGELNLWTALITAKKLRSLGATVLLTRKTLAPVSTENPETFNPEFFYHQYLYNNLEGWLGNYLNQTATANISQAGIIRAERSANPYSSAFNPKYKIDKFFIGGEDLDARARMIDAFQPDITLDIHFDAKDSYTLQSETQNLEAFVPGGFALKETASRAQRAMALKHALEVRRWNQSVELADTITQSMSQDLKIPRLAEPTYPGIDAFRVRDGVYARNLYITRRALSSLVVYLECLHYDDPREHRQLALKDRVGTYESLRFQYPQRLDTISTSIEKGILEYFRRF